MLQRGNKAPAFRLQASTGKTIKLSDYEDRTVVLYFYPRDNTPGCTTEALDFQAALPELERANAVVLGVSKDSIESHCKFADKQGLQFPLLSDPEGAVIEKYGAWGEKNMYGKKSMGIIRTTVVIGPDGRIRAIFPKVKVKGHVDQVLETVRAIQQEAGTPAG
jgi:thioredoxin-dependent peroxiredoxin